MRSRKFRGVAPAHIVRGTLRCPSFGARVAAVAAVALAAPSVGAQGTANLVGVTRAQLDAPAGYSCQMPPPADTIATSLYATLRGTRPSGMQETEWLHYERAVLETVRRALVLPHDIQLAAFSSPFPLSASSRHWSADGALPQQGTDRVEATSTTPGLDGSTDVRGEQRGVLLGQEDGQPVPYATVTLSEAGQSRLTDSVGGWRIVGLAPGRYAFHVRRIGYAPKDTVVVVGAEIPAKTDTIRISSAAARLKRVTIKGKRPDAYVTLTLSTVVAVTLDADGSFSDAHVTASSASGPADSMVVASLRRAAIGFPKLPEARDHQPVMFGLVVSMNEPRPGQESIVVGRVEEAVWAAEGDGEAYIDASAHPDLSSGLAPKDRANDMTTLQFVVDPSGHIITSTARDPENSPEPVGYHFRPYEARVRDSLSKFHFTPARVGACPVPQLVVQSFVIQGR